MKSFFLYFVKLDNVFVLWLFCNFFMRIDKDKYVIYVIEIFLFIFLDIEGIECLLSFIWFFLFKLFVKFDVIVNKSKVDLNLIEMVKYYI